MDILVSVVIPTRNRQKYLIGAVKQIAAINNPQLEIVIHDNSTEKSLKEFFSSFSYIGNLFYKHSSENLSFVENFNRAVELASGDYVIMIGDDDGILPNIIEVAKMAKMENMDAVYPTVNAVYHWPTGNPLVRGAENGYLRISHNKFKEKVVNTHEGLNRLMKNAGQDYIGSDIARLYHGLVKREVLQSIKTERGAFFGGLTPDIYMAVALSIVCRKVKHIKYSISISGICPSSGASDSVTGKHVGKLEDAPHFRGHSEYSWDEKVPPIYSVETIWADSALHALKDFNQLELYNSYNEKRINAICAYKYKSLYKEVYLKGAASFLYLRVIGFIYCKIPLVKKVLQYILRKKSKVVKFYGVSDISEAVDKAMSVSYIPLSKSK